MGIIFSEEILLYIRNGFIQFLKNQKKLKKIKISTKKILRFPISIDKLWDHDPFLTKNLLEKPTLCMSILKEALDLIFKKKKSEKKQRLNFIPDINGPFGKKFCTLSSLRSHFLGEMICIKGIVVKLGERRVKIRKAVSYSNISGKFFVKDYKKEIEEINFSAIKETETETMELEYGLSKFTDWQSILIQDSITEESNSFFPKNLIALVEDDLINYCKVKDDVEICGIYKPFFNHSSSGISPNLSVTLEVLSIKKNSEKIENHPNQFDYLIMRNFSFFVNSFEKLSQMILPKISGQEMIKKGILLFLVADNEKNNTENHPTANAINILVTEECWFEKNEYFRFISSFCPGSVFLKGKNSSEKSIEPRKEKNIEDEIRSFKKNDLNLDGKILCIDKLDRLTISEQNRLQEIMEQNKFDVDMEKFSSYEPAKCKIFATRNIYHDNFNTFVKKRDFGEVSDSILQRFDLNFFILENSLLEEDKKMLNFVLDSNRNQSFFFLEIKKKKKIKLYLKKKRLEKEKKKKIKETFSINFLKIFINFSKKKIRPILSSKGSNFILNFYKKKILFNQKYEPLNIKKLESIIKLSIAFAKSQLRSVVLEKDVKKIIYFWKEVSNQEKKSQNPNPEEEKMKVLEKKSNKDNRNDFIPKLEKKKKRQNFFWEINCIEKSISTFSPKKNNRISNKFFRIKKSFSSKNYCSILERLIRKWLKGKICIIFTRNIIKI